MGLKKLVKKYKLLSKRIISVGQKTHPLGFRLGITQEHRSAWYANFNQYANLLEEDDLIRTYLNKLAKAASISDIKINRNGLGDQIQLNIETGRPGALVGESGLGIENLLKNIKKLEDRVAFRRAIREALQAAHEDNVSGVKIQVSGRLNGAEIARSEWVREGRVPLQTLRADIDYSAKEANTIYGVLGVKVWLFKNEILAK